MILATARADPLLRRLKHRAGLLARQRALLLKQRLSSGPVDWRSARSLWPDLELD